MTGTQQETATCPGCEHSTALHYRDVNGAARCLWTRSGHSTSGVIGLPYTLTCDCVEFHSEQHAAAVAKKLTEQQERDRRMAELVESVRAQQAAAAAEPASRQHKDDYDAGKLATTDGQPPVHFGAPAPNPATDSRGMHPSYWVLSDAERAKGFVRPVRNAYLHAKCGSVTTMGRALAETYAAKPDFYGATYCCACGGHYPVGEHGEFTWDGSTEKVGT